MKLKSPSLPLGEADYQSQHELVVRLLVGRVDDDTAQARAPAVFVPAIFVDNPWSKVLGRDVQGFDKRMADFCVAGAGGPRRLLPDGRVPADAGPDAGRLKRLGDLVLVRLVEETGSQKGPPILQLDCSPDKYEDWDAFQRVDLSLALGTSSMAGMRWRQSDFDALEFRRSFADSAVTEGVRGFRSIQVAPVANRGLERSWISGTFTVDDDLRIVHPSGVATITLHAARGVPGAPRIPAAPRAWNLLCKMLGSRERADIELPTGSWYRMLLSMDLTIDDGLDWTRANL
jgi:hypothetical protein